MKLREKETFQESEYRRMVSDISPFMLIALCSVGALLGLLALMVFGG